MKTLNACFGRRFNVAVASGLGRTILRGSAFAALCLASILPLRAETQGRIVLSGHVPAAVVKSTMVGALPSTNHLRLAIGLPLRNRQALTNLLRDIYNPASTNYHHFLTAEQFAEQFGPTAADFQALVAFARSNNLVMANQYHPNRMFLDVDGTVADIERAFGVNMREFKHPRETRNFYATTNEPSVPAGLAVADISGLNNYILPYPKYTMLASNLSSSTGSPHFGSGPGGTYMGADFRNAYIPGVTLNGAGQTVGLLQFDGYFPSDIQEYEGQNGLPNVPLVNVYLDGYNGTPTGTGGEVEVSLDIEMVISMAPGISKVMVYEAGPFGTPNDILNKMATDNIAKQISCSWGWGGGPQASTEQIFLEMAAQGQTFCNASGDDDAFAPGQVDDPGYPGSPSSSPNILQVGGTTLSTSGAGGSWTSEQVWNWGNDSGSSGGVSSFYAIPSWQQGINMTSNQGSTSFRNIPDVAMTADNVYVIADQGQQQSVGGTSCAAPLWGGFIALVNQQASNNGQSPIGFMNPALYAIGQSPAYNQCFHDITLGNNFNSISPNLYSAVPGYDLCTGWGTPGGSNLINTLAPPVLVPVFTVLTNQVVGGNGNGMVDPNECDSLFFTIQNIAPITATSVQASISTTTPGVTVVQSQATLTNIPSNGMVTNANPFEISTTPDFICGTTIYLTLTIKCDQTTSTLVVALPTGSLGGTVRFDNSTLVPITGADGGTSIINVSNVDSAVMHLAVSAYILEPFDFGLTLQLIGPDGTTVLLSQNNGGSGQNYGLDCGNGTTFDDGALVPISSGQAPFLGTYQPQSPLSIFNGKTGTNVNGGWQLHATDAFGQNASIQCWSLILSPSTCQDGGGQCPGVDLALGLIGLPQPVMVGSNLTYTVSVTNQGPDTATGVALTMNLPASASVASISSSQGSSQLTGSLLTCNIGTLSVRQVATITVVVNPNTAGTIYCSASVGAQQQELDAANNSATVANRVSPPQADLTLSMVANPSPVLLDGLLTYTATIVNHGPSAATNVVLSNTLPLSASYVSARATQGTIVNQANLVIANIGTLQAGSNAVVTIQVSPLVLGPITDTATVSSPVSDPVVGNNTVSVHTTVTAAADLAVTVTAPPSVVLGSNYIYQLSVQNLGPSTATDVNLRDNVPGGLTVLAANSPQGSISISGNTINCVIGSLPANSSATLTVTVGTSNLFGSVPVTVLNTASVTSDQADPNTSNNSATVSTVVDYQNPHVVAAGNQLLGESFTPTNGMIDPGEAVTMMLRLQNIGNFDIGIVTARLLASGGVTPVGSQIGTYGVLTAGGLAASQAFTFTAAQTNGGTIIATLQLQTNGVFYTNVDFSFALSLTKNFANTNNIIIPDHGPGSPYPSTNIVSGISGIIGKVAVTFTNFNHTYPDDVDMLLVGPGGQNVLLMSHAGYNGLLTNAQLAFDSSATNANGSPAFLPSSSQIISGTYQPSQYGAVNFTNNFNGTIALSTNNPPPAPPYGTNLNIFNGTHANGAWALYVFDSSQGDQGVIVGGWSLAITSGAEINPVVDLAVSGKATPNPVQEGNNLTYTFTVTNIGPNVASVVQFTNMLPANSTFVSATNSASVPYAINANGALYYTFTNLAAGSSVTVTVVVTPNAGGTLASTATVTGSDSDPNQSNNSTTVTTTVNAPIADLAVTMSGAPNAVTGSNVLYVITVTNNGPGTAFGVVLTDPTMGVLNLGLGSTSGVRLTNGAVVCNLGTLSSGAGAVVNIFLSSTQALTVTNTVTATTASSDPNAVNNTANVVTVFSSPAPSIIAGTARLVSGAANGSIVPGQTATVSLPLINIGTADTTNLMATLLATNGVTPSSQNSYGVLTRGGGTMAKSFTFTANGGNGGIVTATLLLTDGNNNLGMVSFPFNLPATNTFANTGAIIIPDHGPASPYPAVISVSNVAGVVSKATVTLSNYNHQFPNDVEVLLVAPSGENIVLMAGNGGGSAATNLVLTFDDAAASSLPATSQFVPSPLVSGTFQPTDDGLTLAFPNPAPGTPTGSTLSSLNGIVANGNWALYVLDNSPGDNGIIAKGWSLSLSSVSPVNAEADLGVNLTLPAGSFYPGNPLNITVVVTNKGPATASNVVITNTLAAGLNFVSTSLGAYSTVNGAYVLNVGSLDAGSSTNFTITLNPAAGGVYSSTVSAGGDQLDVNLQDNVAQASLQVQNPPRLGARVGSVNGGAALTLSVTGPAGTYQILASTNLSLSLSNWTTVAITNTLTSSFQFTDTNVSQFPQRYYRVILVP